MKVLVVDDDASVRGSLRKVLEDEGYEVILAGDGQEAVERFGRDQVDLVLMDLGLPIMNGWDAFERITSQNPVLPVIIITGQADQYDTALAAGVGALMEKPLDAPRLLQTMQKLLAEPNETRLFRRCGYERGVRHVWTRRRPFLHSLRRRRVPPFRYPRSHRDGDVSEF